MSYQVAIGRKISGVPERWRHQYFLNGKWSDVVRQETYLKLLAAGDDADKIDQIIGNSSWTHEYCSGCDSSQGEFIIFGEACICITCFLKAAEEVKAKLEVHA